MNLKIDQQNNPGLNSLVNEINQNMEELISQLKYEQWDPSQIAEALANAGFSIEKITKFLIDEGLPQKEFDDIMDKIEGKLPKENKIDIIYGTNTPNQQ